MNVDDFKFSSHAELRMKERGVDRSDVMDTVRGGTKSQQQYKGTHGGWVWKMSKTINGKRLAVVTELYKNTSYVVSAFYEE